MSTTTRIGSFCSYIPGMGWGWWPAALQQFVNHSDHSRYCGIVAGPHRHLRILGLGIGLVYDDMVQCKLRLVPRSSFRPSTVYSMTLID